MGLHSHSIVQNDNLYLLFLIFVHLSSSFFKPNPKAIQKIGSSLFKSVGILLARFTNVSSVCPRYTFIIIPPTGIPRVASFSSGLLAILLYVNKLKTPRIAINNDININPFA